MGQCKMFRWQPNSSAVLNTAVLYKGEEHLNLLDLSRTDTNCVFFSVVFVFCVFLFQLTKQNLDPNFYKLVSFSSRLWSLCLCVSMYVYFKCEVTFLPLDGIIKINLIN